MNTHRDVWHIAEQTPQHMTWNKADGFIQITWCTPQIVRIRQYQTTPAAQRSWSVVPDNAQWEPIDYTIEQIGAVVRLSTPVWAVIFDQRDGTLRCTNKQGAVFCIDEKAPTFGTATQLHKTINPEERFYGFGERTGPLEKSGLRYTNWTLDPEYPHTQRVDNMYAAMPVYVSMQPNLAYGIFFNTTWRSTFDIGHTHPQRMIWETDGPEIDYFIVFGPTPAAVVEGWHTLLGAMPLPPRWALGYHQSRWGYESEPVMRELMAQFRGRSIPCDALHFDIDYMQGYRVFTWHPQRFPNPQKLLADMHAWGFRCVTIIDPGVKVDPAYPVYQTGVEQHMFIRSANGDLFSGYVWPDDSVFADYTRAEVRNWWGNLHQDLLSYGVDGIWNDMNEPTVFDAPFSAGGGNAGTIDLDAPQGAPHEQTIHAEVHNLYGSLMSQATREGLLRLRPNERPFVLTRSGFAGLQRWATLWTGDNTALWEHLEMTLPQIANLGLSGIPFCGVDIGGFFNNATPELWARWIQLGAFLPFCRGHSCAGTRPAEPWEFGPRTEAIACSYISLRYRLLPYLYTLFQEAATTGAPIIRPLVYHFPDDATTFQGNDQAMCGPFLLLAPIVRPGVEHRAVYLPAGVWYDWWTGERIQGPVHLLAHAPLEKLPLYVRGGAILPFGPVMQHTDEQALDPLTLDIYPGGTSSWTLYEDDGHSFDFAQGIWAQTSFSCSEDQTSSSFEIHARTGAWQPATRSWVINIHGPQPQRVTVDQQPTQAWLHADRATTLLLEDDGQAHVIRLEWH